MKWSYFIILCTHHITVRDLEWLQSELKSLWLFTKQLSTEHFIDACRKMHNLNSHTKHEITLFKMFIMIDNCLHFPLKTAMRGLNFFNFSASILPPSRNSLL